jgi:hypothetical protein
LQTLKLQIVAAFVSSMMANAVGSQPAPDRAALEAMTARFAPVEIRVDLSTLPDNERRAMAKIIDAARVVDALYLRQASPKNEARRRGGRIFHDHSAYGAGHTHRRPI